VSTSEDDARSQVGGEDEFLFLAGDDVTLDVAPSTAWALLEADRQEALLRALSPRFVARELLEELPDGYRCRTVSRAGLGRRRSFESVVWLDAPRRSVEVQEGTRTDLRYTTTYEPAGDATVVRCEQAYRARSASFESGAAIGQLQQRAVAVVADRLRAARAVVEGAIRPEPGPGRGGC